jgi:hypothetical protein
MTLDVYADLFDADLDALAARLDESVSDVQTMCKTADVIELPTTLNPLYKENLGAALGDWLHDIVGRCLGT